MIVVINLPLKLSLFHRTHIYPVAVLGRRSKLQTTLMINVVHDTRWQHGELVVVIAGFVVRTVAPITAATYGNKRVTL